MQEIEDKVARKQISDLKKRLEGARLVPGIWILLKKSLESILSWKGWEVIGITFACLFFVFILVNIIFSTNNNCNQAELNRKIETYGGVCEKLNMRFAHSELNMENKYIICVGNESLLKIDLKNLSISEMISIEGNKIPMRTSTRPLTSEEQAALENLSE